MKFTKKELEMITDSLRVGGAILRAETGKLNAGDKYDKLSDKIEKELLK